MVDGNGLPTSYQKMPVVRQSRIANGDDKPWWGRSDRLWQSALRSLTVVFVVRSERYEHRMPSAVMNLRSQEAWLGSRSSADKLQRTTGTATVSGLLMLSPLGDKDGPGERRGS
ncbi:hypothetical protein LIPSTDRAFT_106767 [Lipomyces starkeyi NRRL Y-11557]|uniref:Uncharacterized protein n=1 Tax=Lipomyces starkeyi NRRL Y-11557 TaxID=675824 RepID=A0A1E3Q152_LIPST|nr:hypothetical protein LIPSTDRAFT_106767 [Lipomyces starkeyi NRRL Y-11557]